jgi:hypothetical protein
MVMVPYKKTSKCVAGRIDIPQAGFYDLSDGDENGYVRDVSGWIRDRPKGIAVADWLKELIEKRRRLHLLNPDVLVPWVEVRSRLLEKNSTTSK